MNKPIEIHAERSSGRLWTYQQRSPGNFPDCPLHNIMNWVLEQMNFGNFEVEHDRRGDIVSLTLGRKAAGPYESADDALAEALRRLQAVNFAGVAAQARESGIQPGIAHLSKAITQEADDWGRRNTELHYAFELIKVLARLNKKTFSLEAPPIAGLAPESVIAYLREATRCWLYGFHGASVALSRACLEETLKTLLPRGSEAPPLSHLESLIDAARQRRILDDCMTQVAHSIRKTGNRFLHGYKITETDSRETLEAIRSIVEHVFAS